MAADRESSKLYTIKQLEWISRVPKRTIHFYVKEGLLPPPSGRGPSARYGEMHRLRLELIGMLKCSLHLRLSGIRGYIERLSAEELRREIREFGGDPDAALLVKSSGDVGVAFDRLEDNVRWEGIRSREALSEPAGDDDEPTKKRRGGVLHFALPRARRRAAERMLADADQETSDDMTGDTWQRVRVAHDLEIHYRCGSDEARAKEILRLIEMVRNRFRR
ncbi:MAG: MerR family transcriptional regulator [Candidatus Latescibacterota bacterium]|nr:MAG: MerR family transcriptional regulator [Candidatus Latescibacterota bacterium]